MPSSHAPDGQHVLPQARLAEAAASGVRDRARAATRILVAVAVAIVVLSAPGGLSGGARVVLIAAGVYVAASTVRVWQIPVIGPSARADLLRALVDVLAVAAVAATVHQPRTAVLLFLCAIPLGYSLTLSASAVAAITAGAISAVFAIWMSGIAFDDAYGLSDGALLLVAFALGWCGLVACLIAVERERRSIRISELSGSVQELLRQAIRAEERERQRVADLLHDDVLQILLATRHDIADAMDGELSLLPDARAGLEAATRRLRETIGGLRTDGVAAHSLGDGVRLLAHQSAERASFDIDVDIDANLDDVHQPLLLSVVRDLLRDAERSSAPTRLALRLRDEDGAFVLVIAHDDRRFALGLDFTSDDAGELLDAVEHRVRAVAGTFDVDRTLEGHRTLRVAIPIRLPAEQVPDGHQRSTSPLGARLLRGAPSRTEVT